MEESSEGGLFAAHEGGGAGEFEEPRGVADGNDGADDALRFGRWAARDIDGGQMEAVDVEVRRSAREFGDGERGELDLAAPAVDVGEIAADVAGEGRDRKIGGFAGISGDRVATFAHGGGGFGGPMGGGAPSEAGAVCGGNGGVGHGRAGGVGGGRWGGGHRGSFFLGDAIGGNLGIATGGQPEQGDGGERKQTVAHGGFIYPPAWRKYNSNPANSVPVGRATGTRRQRGASYFFSIVNVSRMAPDSLRKVKFSLSPSMSMMEEPASLREIHMAGWLSGMGVALAWPALPVTTEISPECAVRARGLV